MNRRTTIASIVVIVAVGAGLFMFLLGQGNGDDPAIQPDRLVSIATGDGFLIPLQPAASCSGDDLGIYEAQATRFSATGHVAWTTEIPWSPFTTGFVLVDGVLIQRTSGDDLAGDWDLIGLDAATGTPIWQRTIGRYFRMYDSVGDKLILLTEGAATGLSPTTGEELWTIELGQRIADGVDANNEIANDGQTFFVNDNGTVRAISAATGATVWAVDLGEDFSHAPLLSNEGTVVYQAIYEAEVFGLHAQTGEILSTSSEVEGQLSSPTRWELPSEWPPELFELSAGALPIAIAVPVPFDTLQENETLYPGRAAIVDPATGAVAATTEFRDGLHLDPLPIDEDFIAVTTDAVVGCL